MCAGVSFLLGRVYSITVLWTLLNRPKVATGAVSTYAAGRSVDHPTTKPNQSVNLAQISVHHSSSVVVEDGSTLPSHAHDVKFDRYAAKTPFQSGIPADSKLYMVPLDKLDYVQWLQLLETAEWTRLLRGGGNGGGGCEIDRARLYPRPFRFR